jgi:hypothetical protein
MSTIPEVKVSTFGKDSGHWYDQDGNLIEQVEKAKKGTGFTKTTLRHARKLDLAPGCTTIIKCAHAEQLVNWRINQGILAARTLDQQPDENDRAYLQRVHDDANTHARDAADEGTRIHAAIEMHLRGEAYPPTYVRHVEAVTDLLLERCGDAKWLPERGVVSKLGYATKADCVSEFAGWLVDFKGCDGDQGALDAKKTYESHAMQLAATRECIAPELRCAIVYVSRDNPGACSFVEVAEDELRQGFAMFRGLLAFWQAKNKHVPTWATGAF